MDAASNVGPYSNMASAAAVTPDTQPPTAPSNPTATAASSSQINLSWTASTDNVGVTGYYIERCQGAGCTLFFRVASLVWDHIQRHWLGSKHHLRVSSTGDRRGREPEPILEHCQRYDFGERRTQLHSFGFALRG